MAARVHDVFPAEETTRSGYWSGTGAIGQLNHSASAIEYVRQKIAEFLRLPVGWDSYTAPRISPDAASAAADILIDLILSGATAPTLVPTPRGGIQAEWHSGPKSLELEFVSPVVFEYYYVDDAHGIDEEETLSFDLDPIYRRIGEF